MRLDEYRDLIQRQTGIDVVRSLPSKWEQFAASPTSENLGHLIAEIQKSGFDGETSQMRAAFNELQCGINPNKAVPFAVQIGQPSLPSQRIETTGSKISDVVRLKNLVAPNQFGDLVSYRSEEWNTDVHFTVASSNNIYADGRFEEVPQGSRAIVIWFHGSGAQTARGTNFFQEMNQLSRFNLASISMDMPHHGNGPRDKEYNAKELAEWTHRIIRHYRDKYPGKPIILAGHSAGPSFILNYLSTYPETHGINGAVLMSPGGPFDERGMRQHYVEYAKHLSGELRKPGGLCIIQEGSQWVNRLQMTWPFLQPGTVEQIKIPVLIFAGDRDELYPDMKYLEDFTRRLPNAELIVGKGIEHYIFTIDQEPSLGKRIYSETFNDRSETYRKDRLRFVAALVLDFVDKKFGTESRSSLDPAPVRAATLYKSNDDFRRVVDLTVLEDIKGDALEDVRNKMGKAILSTIDKDDLKKIIEPYVATFKDMGKKRRLDARIKMSEAVESLSPKSGHHYPEIDLSEFSEEGQKLIEELMMELGTRKWQKIPKTEREKMANPVSRAVESIYRGNSCEIDGELASKIRELVSNLSSRSAQKMADTQESQKLLISWEKIRLALSLYDSSEMFRTHIAGGERDVLLRVSHVNQALEAWGYVRAAIILFEGNDTFREFALRESAGFKRSDLIRPDNARVILGRWEEYCGVERERIIKDIPSQYHKFYESLETAPPPSSPSPRSESAATTPPEAIVAEVAPAERSKRRPLYRSDIDGLLRGAETKGKEDKGDKKVRLDLQVKILSALREHLEAEDKTRTGEDIYRLYVLGGHGEKVSNAWQHLHFRSADTAVSTYRGIVPTWDWYKQYASEMEKAAGFQSSYAAGDSARISRHLQGRLETLKTYESSLNIPAPNVVTFGENGDLLSPFRLFGRTNHVTLLSRIPFGPPNFERFFSPAQIAFAHRMLAHPGKLAPLGYEHGVGGFYINAILTGLAPEMKSSAVRSVFYFKIVDGKKVYIEPSSPSPSPDDYRNAEIRFIDKDGSVKTLDVVANPEGSFPEGVRCYIKSLRPQAFYVGPKSAPSETDSTTAVQFVDEVMETTGARLVVARAETTSSGTSADTDPILRETSIVPREVFNLAAYVIQKLATTRAHAKTNDPVSIDSLRGIFGQRLLPAGANFARGGLLFTAGDLGSDAILGNWERLRTMTPKKLAKIYGLLSAGNAAGQLTANTLLKGIISRVPLENLRNSIGGGLPLFFGFVALELGETGTVDLQRISISMANIMAVKVGINGSIELFRKSKFGMRLARSFSSKLGPSGRRARAGTGIFLQTIIEFTAIKVLDEIEKDLLFTKKVEIVTENLERVIHQDLELLRRMQRGEDVTLEEMLSVEAEFFAYKTYLDEMATKEEGKPTPSELATSRFSSADKLDPFVRYVEFQKDRVKGVGDRMWEMSGWAGDGMPGPPSLYKDPAPDIDENYSKEIADVPSFKVLPNNFSSHWWPLSLQIENYLRNRNKFIIEGIQLLQSR